MDILREVIAVVVTAIAELKVVAADHADSLVVTIAFQQLLAETEKAGIWQAIIFQNNGLFHLLEYPIYSGRNTPLAAQIHLRKISQNFTVPVHTIDDSSGSCDLLGFPGTIGPWAIAHDQQFWRSGSGYFRKNHFGRIRPVEDDKRDRRGELKIRHQAAF